MPYHSLYSSCFHAGLCAVVTVVPFDPGPSLLGPELTTQTTVSLDYLSYAGGSAGFSYLIIFLQYTHTRVAPSVSTSAFVGLAMGSHYTVTDVAPIGLTAQGMQLEIPQLREVSATNTPTTVDSSNSKFDSSSTRIVSFEQDDPYDPKVEFLCFTSCRLT